MATLEGGPAEGPAARFTDLEIAETTLETKEVMKLHIGEKLSMLSKDTRQEAINYEQCLRINKLNK